jgi:hypothetical protein
MFTSCGHREEQEQHVELGTTREGKLTALRHHKVSPTSPFDDWAEPSLGMGAQLYACPNYEGIYQLIRPISRRLKRPFRNSKPSYGGQEGARSREALIEAIMQALLTVTSRNARGWFQHCGYDFFEERKS